VECRETVVEAIEQTPSTSTLELKKGVGGSQAKDHEKFLFRTRENDKYEQQNYNREPTSKETRKVETLEPRVVNLKPLRRGA